MDFWTKVDKNGPTMPHMDTPCWVWTGTVNSNGYGTTRIDGKPHGTHRVAYELSTGNNPGELKVDHRCHNTLCVNPSHLRAITHKQNLEHQLGAHQNSQSGVRGVCWEESRQRWRASRRLRS